MLYLPIILFLLAVIIILLIKRNMYFKELYRFSRRRAILSPAELEMYKVLTKVMGKNYYIFPQLHLNRLINYKVKVASTPGPFHHIDQKSVDFVLCEKKTLEPVLVIELDEKTHTGEWKIRDDMVEDLLNQARLPFIRIKNNGVFDGETISEKIHDALMTQVFE